jgi:D-alanyl-D-alanine carboxypeptidase/D-alanyl-D-alanine-endopeptidase (penicillin-binding protein 4)
MKSPVEIVATAALCICLAAPATSQQASLPLQARARQIVEGTSGDWGVMAWSVDRRQPLIAIRANEAMVPASNNKVFTAVWALDLLGPDYRFPTDLLISGSIENGVLRGDVILRGSGDPAFGYPEWEDEPMDPLRVMARRLQSMGIRSVQGSVIGDATAFDSTLVGPDWPRDTGGGSAFYAPRVSGLPFQRNVIYIEAEPGAGGGVQITLDPPVRTVPVTSTARAGGGRAWAVREATNDTIEVKGSVSNRLNRFAVGVAHPAMLAADALRHAMTEVGITVGGATRVGDFPEEARLVHRHLSIPLAAMIPKLNQESDNFFAEHLWKAAAREALGVGSYAAGGPASALHFIRRAGVPAGQVYQFDGSGLSSLNRASANSLVRALVYAHGRPYSASFHSSMAVAADPGGTMRNLFRGTPAADNLHAKTGYISGVRALSGYVRASNGELIAFSFLYNGRNTFGARDTQSKLGELLANYGGTSVAAR